jgi:multidrug transporter EmrE-like cation transporter
MISVASTAAWALLIGSIILGAFGQVFLKLAVERVGLLAGVSFYLGLAHQWWLYAGIASYGLSFLAWLAALRSFDIGFARPMTSIGYVITYGIAIAVLGEELSLRRVIGVVVITSGVLLLK